MSFHTRKQGDAEEVTAKCGDTGEEVEVSSFGDQLQINFRPITNKNGKRVLKLASSTFNPQRRELPDGMRNGLLFTVYGYDFFLTEKEMTVKRAIFSPKENPIWFLISLGLSMSLMLSLNGNFGVNYLLGFFGSYFFVNRGLWYAYLAIRKLMFGTLTIPLPIVELPAFEKITNVWWS